MTAADTWANSAVELIERLRSSQRDAIEAAADLCAEVIAAGDRVFTFGSGHSQIASVEMFPRYGSYPGFVSINELAVTNYAQTTGANGLAQAMFLERQSGFAEVVLDGQYVRRGDALIVFSVSGANAVPVEMAAGAAKRGLRTVAVTSVEHCQTAVATGRPTVLERADVVIDLCVPLGGAFVRLPEGPSVGPSSTLAYVVVVNMLKLGVAERLAADGKLPPVIAHAAVVGPQASAASIRAALDEHARRVRGRE